MAKYIRHNGLSLYRGCLLHILHYSNKARYSILMSGARYIRFRSGAFLLLSSGAKQHTNLGMRESYIDACVYNLSLFDVCQDVKTRYIALSTFAMGKFFPQNPYLHPYSPSKLSQVKPIFIQLTQICLNSCQKKYYLNI